MGIKKKGREQLVQGNIAIAEGAIRAGCRFFAGYPITPSSEIMTRMSQLLRDNDGVFIQMEDEIASICSVIGASWTGAKAMTATSGPGLSLMQEAIGYGYFTETPMVVVDVQRAGPATGQATHVSQGDVMQLKYGTHGDVYPIVLAPWSVQECFDLTVRAFNLAETYRLPVFIAADEAIGHLRENAVIPESVDVVNRVSVGSSEPFDTDEPAGVPPMPAFGDGTALQVTGSTHDGKGFRKVDDPHVHEKLVTRLMNKTLGAVDHIVHTESLYLDDAQVGIFAYGICARTALAAVKQLREMGIAAGMLRPKTLWPFPSKQVAQKFMHTKMVIIPELNTGMMSLLAKGECPVPVHSINQTNGMVMSPGRIVQVVKELL